VLLVPMLVPMLVILRAMEPSFTRLVVAAADRSLVLASCHMDFAVYLDYHIVYYALARG
jgi:hypothetical protein